MVGSSNFESKSIRPKVIPKTTTQTSPGLATTDPLIASQCTLARRPVTFHSYLTAAPTTGGPQDPREPLLCSSVGSDRRVLIPPLSMLTVPYKRQHHRPFHTAEGDGCCVSWRSLFLTGLRFRAQVCLEDLKIQTSPPEIKQKQNKNGEKKKKNRKEEKKNTLLGPFMQIMCSAFYFKISWQMIKTNVRTVTFVE